MTMGPKRGHTLDDDWSLWAAHPSTADRYDCRSGGFQAALRSPPVPVPVLPQRCTRCTRCSAVHCTPYLGVVALHATLFPTVAALDDKERARAMAVISSRSPQICLPSPFSRPRVPVKSASGPRTHPAPTISHRLNLSRIIWCSNSQSECTRQRPSNLRSPPPYCSPAIADSWHLIRPIRNLRPTPRIYSLPLRASTPPPP